MVQKQHLKKANWKSFLASQLKHWVFGIPVYLWAFLRVNFLTWNHILIWHTLVNKNIEPEADLQNVKQRLVNISQNCGIWWIMSLFSLWQKILSTCWVLWPEGHFHQGVSCPKAWGPATVGQACVPSISAAGVRRSCI